MQIAWSSAQVVHCVSQSGVLGQLPIATGNQNYKSGKGGEKGGRKTVQEEEREGEERQAT